MAREDLILEMIKNHREESIRGRAEDARRLEAMEKKLDELVAFRWKQVGGSLAISAILAFAFNVLHTLIK